MTSEGDNDKEVNIKGRHSMEKHKLSSRPIEELCLKKKQKQKLPVHKTTEISVSKRYLYIYVQSSIVHNCQKVKATQVSTNG